MVNVIFYEIIQRNEYNLQKLVDCLSNYFQDNMQGLIINDYDDFFLNATYWYKKKQKSYQFNVEKKDFDIVETEIIEVVDFGIELKHKQLLIFGNKQMAQRIITMISIVSNNAYSITELVIDIEKLVEKLCSNQKITITKIRLNDITIEKGVLVNCIVDLKRIDNPKKLVLKYTKNIVVIAFKLDNLMANVTIYKSGKISIGKIGEGEKNELIQNVVNIVG